MRDQPAAHCSDRKRLEGDGILNITEYVFVRGTLVQYPPRLKEALIRRQLTADRTHARLTGTEC